MTDENPVWHNEAARRAWEANAAHWDDYMGEAGNDFVNLLIWPRLARLLELQPGERVLDAACGNGLYALRLAEMGATVVGFDFSTGLIERARERAAEYNGRITYHILDATDLVALLTLGEQSFDAAVCNMALFDMADIAPMAEGLSRLLRPGGRFIFSVMHPCFNGLHVTLQTEAADDGKKMITRHFLKLSAYLTAFTSSGIALRGQPMSQPYFHRPLQELLAPFLSAGFVLDALEEAAFPPTHRPDKLTSWSRNYAEFPPVLLTRLRNTGWSEG